MSVLVSIVVSVSGSVNAAFEGFQDISCCIGSEILKQFTRVFFKHLILRTKFNTGHFENFSADER